MNKILGRRPSGSMVIAITALVVAASGTAIAANLVNGDDLIKKHSLSGNRLRNGSVTGKQINLDKLGKVPSATHADSATSATSATNAANATTATSATHASAAGTVDIIRKIDFRAAANTPVTELLNTGKLKLTAACDATGKLALVASTAADHADLNSYGANTDTKVDDFRIATPQKLNASASPTSEERTVVYTEPGGQTVQLTYLESDKSPFGGTVSTVQCLVNGFATVM